MLHHPPSIASKVATHLEEYYANLYALNNQERSLDWGCTKRPPSSFTFVRLVRLKSKIWSSEKGKQARHLLATLTSLTHSFLTIAPWLTKRTGLGASLGYTLLQVLLVILFGPTRLPLPQLTANRLVPNKITTETWSKSRVTLVNK